MGAQPRAQVERFLDDARCPRRPTALVEPRRRGRTCAARWSSSPAAPTPPSRSPACSPRAASATRRWQLLAAVPGSFAADGLAARLRLEDDQDAARRVRRARRRRTSSAGLDGLIAAIPARPSDADRRDDLRRSVVGVLDELGVEHPLARESRRKLASALY